MIRVVIDGYLLQAKLESALHQIVADAWRGHELSIPGSRRRWDMAYELSGQTTVVEFDGDEHYRHTLKIKGDGEKDALALAAGHRVVRVPYWVQLTTETLLFYFGLEARVIQDFPHGFIATKIFPASFCEMGISRFRQELLALPVPVRDAIVLSLRERIKEHGRKYILPMALYDIA